MARHDVDWNRAKLDYLKHQSKTVTWRRKEYSKKHWYTHGKDWVEKATVWRSKEKDNLLSLATEKAQNEIIEETVNTLKEKYKPDEKVLWEMHKRIMDLVIVALNSMSKGEISSKDLKTYWDIIKTEKGETTKYIKDEWEKWGNITQIIVSDDISSLLK